MPRLYESMTRIQIVGHEPAIRRGWNPVYRGCVRVWRSEESLDAACNPDTSDLLAVIEALGPDASAKDIILAVEQLPRIEAIEVLDADGNGPLLYPNWS